MLPTLLGAALLLLPSDQAALRGSRLLPHASNAVAAGLSIRAATLDTATYARYTGGSGIEQPLLTYTFPSAVVQAGNQIRFKIYGHINDAVGANTLNINLNVTQFTASVPVFIQPQTQGSDVAFEIVGDIAFSQPGISNRGVVVNQKATASYVGGAESSLIVGALVKFTQTDTVFNSATRRGGAILSDIPSSPSTLLSVMATNNDANTTYLVGGQPIGISIGVVVPSNTTLTIQGGYLEVM